ncbi:hypothetical protein DRW42_18370 [Pedobacter miscanthi]|uniref:Uncharacterized protein n=2 Tax=Pedobacter miscanthi TaxID=2259170 RepID=A0A366KSH5_9SPHI|nr:hypothetical protein DRW42_18370 [Pedobacter miscanthi]
MFLSLFTFSNNVSNSIIFQPNPGFQAEWVYQKRNNFTAQAVFQKTAKRNAARLKEFFIRVLAFNKFLLVKLTQLAEASLSIPAALSSFVLEGVPNYPSETVPAS